MLTCHHGVAMKVQQQVKVLPCDTTQTLIFSQPGVMWSVFSVEYLCVPLLSTYIHKLIAPLLYDCAVELLIRWSNHSRYYLLIWASWCDPVSLNGQRLQNFSAWSNSKCCAWQCSVQLCSAAWFVCVGVCVGASASLFASLYTCAHYLFFSKVSVLRLCMRMDTLLHLCVCLCVCVSPWGVSVSLVDVGEFDLALFGGSSQGSQPAQLPQRNRGHLFGLHTSRSVLKRLSKQNPHMNF